MSQWASIHGPCPCGKSSDAYAIDAIDGHGKCFSCNRYFKKGGTMGTDAKTEETKEIRDRSPWPETGTYTYEYLARRGITRETHEFFGVKTQVDNEGVPISVAYPSTKGYTQLRFLKSKDFRFSGTVRPGGFCTDLFPPGSAKAITITEGYDDAMSVFQMLGKYPVYPVKSASSALSDVRADHKYLDSFEKIYLALDDDEPGQAAARQIAQVFGFGKVYEIRLGALKDPHAFLEAGREKEFRTMWYNARRLMPDSVISSFADLRKEFEKRKNAVRYEWPWPSWQRMTGGIEIHRQYLISGLEGTGKTEELHEIAHHLLKTYPDMNLGFVHAEEPVTDTMTMQVGKALKRPIHLEEFRLPDDEIVSEFEKLAGREDRVHFFRHFGSEETDVLLSTIRFMVAACGCRVVLFDNYQHIVSGRTKDRDTEALDYLANQMEKLVKELDFALIAISHENDNELTRGSRNLSKETDVWINIKRDQKSENEFVRNIQTVTFNKNRQAGRTGPAGKLHYDQATATLSELSGDLPA